MKKWMLFLLIIFLSMMVAAEEKELDITVDVTYVSRFIDIAWLLSL